MINSSISTPSQHRILRNSNSIICHTGCCLWPVVQAPKALFTALCQKVTGLYLKIRRFAGQFQNAFPLMVGLEEFSLEKVEQRSEDMCDVTIQLRKAGKTCRACFHLVRKDIGRKKGALMTKSISLLSWHPCCRRTNCNVTHKTNTALLFVELTWFFIEFILP